MAEPTRPASATPPDGQRRVEVVADQTTDGAYEIRLETSGATPSAPAPAVSGVVSTGTRLSAVDAPNQARGSGAAKGIALGVAGVAAVIGVGVVLASGDGSDAAPELDEPQQSDTFRSFVIEEPSSRTLPASALGLDAGVDSEATREPEPLVDEPDSRGEPPVYRSALPEPRVVPGPEPRPLEIEPRMERTAIIDPVPSAEAGARELRPSEMNRLRSIRVDPNLLVDAGNATGDEYDDEYGDEYDDEYGDEYDDEYE